MGWVSMEDEQLQYLSMIMLHSADTVSSKDSPLLLTNVDNTKKLIDEDVVVMQSKISQIKDIFPDYGNVYLAVCLEAYNQNPEEVIQRILKGTLHEDLQRLDTSLETMPQPKSALTLRSKDKGKGKLIESDTSSSAIYKELLITHPSLPASSASTASVTCPSLPDSSASSMGNIHIKLRLDCIILLLPCVLKCLLLATLS